MLDKSCLKIRSIVAINKVRLFVIILYRSGMNYMSALTIHWVLCHARLDSTTRSLHFYTSLGKTIFSCSRAVLCSC